MGPDGQTCVGELNQPFLLDKCNTEPSQKVKKASNDMRRGSWDVQISSN